MPNTCVVGSYVMRQAVSTFENSIFSERFGIGPLKRTLSRWSALTTAFTAAQLLEVPIPASVPVPTNRSGAGNYYLSSTSPFLTNGTTNIGPAAPVFAIANENDATAAVFDQCHYRQHRVDASGATGYEWNSDLVFTMT